MAPRTRSMSVGSKRSAQDPTDNNNNNKPKTQRTIKMPTRVLSKRSCQRLSSKTCARSRETDKSCDKTDEIFQADLLPEWVLVHIFSFLTVKEKCRLTCVSKKWSLLVKDPRLWRLVTDSPQDSGDLLKFIRTYLGYSLWCFIPRTLTGAGLKLLENRCPNLKYLLVNYTHKTQSRHFRHLNLQLHFPVKADGVVLRIPLSPVDNELAGYLVASKNLKRVNWEIVHQFEDFAPIVKMVGDIKKKGNVGGTDCALVPALVI